MAKYSICCLAGDGIGPEIMASAKRVLDIVASRQGFEVEYRDELIGGAAIDAGYDNALPGRTVANAKESDAVLLAAVGGPKWDSTAPGAPRPEAGLLGIRKQLELYINLRPVRIYDALAGASTLKPEVLEGVDMLIVRELTGGLYFGERVREASRGDQGQFASDTCEYTEAEIERVVEFAFEAARLRRGNVVSVDKANVLETSRLWRETVARVAAKHPDVACSNMLVDNAAMQLVARPSQFDVLVTENTFGDILSDEASMLTGSLGMLASASLGTYTPLFEPCHGSAPDIAGKGVANPMAQILSVALMCRYALKEQTAADMIEAAVERTLDQGWRTPDIAAADTDASMVLGTEVMTEKIISNL